MGLFRRPSKIRAMGHCEQCAKRFLFGTLLRGPQPVFLVVRQSISLAPHSVDPRFRSRMKQCPMILPPPDFAHASIRTLYELL